MHHQRLLTLPSRLNEDIVSLPNGDFMVISTHKQTHMGPKTADGRRPVHWWINGQWIQKGWLMPQIPTTMP